MALGHIQADLQHGPLEKVAVFSHIDRLGTSADQLHAIALKDTGLVQLHGQVKARLPTHCGQHRIWALLGDDPFKNR